MDPGEIVEEQIVWQEGVIVSWLAGRILVQAHYQNLNVNCLRYRRVAGSSPNHTPVEPPPPAAPCCRPRWGGCRGGGRRECSRTPCSTGWWTAAEHAYCLSHKINIIFFLTLLAISLFTAYNSVHPNLKAVQARVGKELQFSHKNSKSFEVTYFWLGTCVL